MILKNLGFIRSFRQFRLAQFSGILSLISMLTLATPITAEIYKSTDNSGAAVFSDIKTRQSKAVSLPPMNTHTPANTDHLFSEESTTSKKPLQNFYNQLEILSPNQDEVFRNNAGNITVEVIASPSLLANHKIQILMDGAVASEPQSTNQFSLSEIPRGEHSLSAQIIDTNDNEVLISSSAIQFHIKRHSTLHPKPPAPPRPKKASN